MTTVGCAQLRYTWAERRLDAAGGDFGLVLRSRSWPAALLDDPVLRELLTGLPLAARRLDGEHPPTYLSHVRRAHGSLLVAKRAVGTDGAGRPGNYAVHALFDPSGTLGALDLEPLLTAGCFVLERAVDGVPDDEAPDLPVPAPAAWTAPRTRGRRPTKAEQARWGEVVACGDAAELVDRLAERCRVLPADLVNALEVEGGQQPAGDPGGEPAGEDPAATDAVPSVFAAAARLGALEEPFWWQRRGLDRATWTAELEDWWAEHAPVHRLADGQLWRRWDTADQAGREVVAGEVLERGALVEDGQAAGAVADRPALVDDLVEAGVRGGPVRLTAAARWVAAVGSDDQVVDLAAELVSVVGAGLPPELLARLAGRDPDQLPPVLVTAVVPQVADAATAEPPSLDADALPRGWRIVALRRCLVRDAPAPGAAERAGGTARLAAACRDDELADGLRAAVDEGVDPGDLWDRLGPLVPAGRRQAAFAAADPETADHLLRRGVAPGRRGVAALAALWPAVAATSGWAPAVQQVFAEVQRRERALRVQRTLALLLAVLALAAVAVLAVLLARAVPG